MKKYMIILISLMVFGCTEDIINNSESKSHTLSIAGTWRVIAYEDLLTGKVTTKKVDNSWDMDVIITFNESTDPNKISGYSTTNELSGEFSFKSESSIKISYLATEILEPEWGSRFHLAMGSEILDYTLTGLSTFDLIV